MHLDKHQQLSVRQRGDEIVLKPLPTIEETLEEIHETVRPYLKGKRPLTDEELNQAIRESIAERADQ